MNFKNLLQLGGSALAVALVVVFSTQGAHAKSISVNLHTGLRTLAPTDSAGVVPTTWWNNVISNGTPDETVFPGLTDDAGNLTTVNLRGTGWEANSPELIVTAGGNPNATMMGGGGISGIRPDNGVDAHAAQIELTNVLAELGGAYDVYIYYGTGWNCSVAGCFHGGAGTAYISPDGYTFADQTDVPASAFASKGYATMNGTNAGLGSDPVWDDNVGFIESTGQATNQKGNYVKFEGITAADLVITMDPNEVGYGWNQNSIVGIQVIGQAPVPEPSTFALAGMGLVGLVGYRLRRRRKNG